MRRNAQRVVDFRNQLTFEIMEWFKTKPEVLRIEFKRLFTVQVDVNDSVMFEEHDLGTEYRVVNFLTNDGFVIDNDGDEISIEELNDVELAFILDELEENNYTLN